VWYDGSDSAHIRAAGRGRPRTMVVLGCLAAFAGSAAPTAAPALPPKSSWEGEATAGERRWPVALALTVEGEAARALVDLPGIHAWARPFHGTLDDGHLRLERVSPAGAVLRIEGTLRDGALVGRWSGFGVEADLRLLPRGEPLPAHREVEVTFRNGEVLLAGTLVLPERPGRYPAVVLTHGAGPQSRLHESSNAVWLARHGIAAVVYDKRGVGASTGEWETASLHDLARDAVAAVAVAAAHPEVTSVGIYGYSQGGWIAPLAATLEPRVSFVVAGGVAAVDPMRQTIHHRTQVARQEGFGADVQERIATLWQHLYDSSFGRRERAAAAAEIAAARGEPWFAASGLPELDAQPTPESVREFLAFDPLPVWRRLRIPVWLFWGADDIHVPVAESRARVAAALVEGGNPGFTLRLYSGVAHDLRLAAPAGAADFPRTLSIMWPEIASWIAGVAPASQVR
jgi:dienelactone hydrolase